MKKYIEILSKDLLGTSFKDLEQPEQNVINSIAEAEPIAGNTNETFQEQSTFGQRLADRIAAFGGSWTFIIIFATILICWMLINSVYLAAPKEAFDPYPFILLNLALSSLAALQAPIIMMTQNRQAAKDRMDITENYKVSLKTDLEIMRLHQKIDDLTKKLDMEKS